MSKDANGVYTDGKWEFDAHVAECFDDMLERSIPQYELMRDLCFRIGRNFVTQGTAIADLGCSRGGALARFVDEFSGLGQRNCFIGVEISQPMWEAAVQRFADNNKVTIVNMDLRKEYPRPSILGTATTGISLTLAVLVLQFIPIEYRHMIMRRIYKSTVPGGALIFVEKVLGNTTRINTALVNEYYTLKRDNGYSDEQIERKRLSLEGVLVPITARWNEDILKESGFEEVDCFWRSLNFAGWIAIKQ